MSDGRATPDRVQDEPVWMKRLNRAIVDMSASDRAYLGARVRAMPASIVDYHLVNRSTKQIQAWLRTLLMEATRS